MKRSFYTLGSLIILLISAFVFVLVPAFVGRDRNSKMPAFGKYAGKEIRYEQNSDFANYVSRYADMVKNQGQEIDNSTYYYIFNYAFNAVVTKLAYTDAVKKSGWKVSESAINRTMVQYFTDEKGNYSPKLYKEADASAINSMHKELADTLTTGRFNDDCFGSAETVGKDTLFGVKKSANEASFIKAMGNSERAFNLASFNMSDYPESEKTAYGKANAQKFVKYSFSVITCQDKSKAESVAKRVNNNEIGFDDAVGEYSKKTYSDEKGKLTSSYNYQLEKIVKNADDLTVLAAMKETDPVKVVETAEGWTLFRADAAAAQPDFTNADTITAVNNYLTTYENGHIEDYYTNIAKQFAEAVKAKNFDAACKQFNVKKTEVAAFPLNYGSESVADKLDTSAAGLSGADTNESFLTAAFSLKENDVSVPLVLGKTVAVIQMTNQKNDAEKDTTDESVYAELGKYDNTAVSAAIMSSPKLVNNFSTVYFNNFMNNNSGSAN